MPLAPCSNHVLAAYAMFLRHGSQQRTKRDVRARCRNVVPVNPLAHLLNEFLVSQETLLHYLIIPSDMTMPDPFVHKLEIGSPPRCERPPKLPQYQCGSYRQSYRRL